MTTINTSETPATNAGVYISQVLEKKLEQDILLLLSGGSAISVLQHIDTEFLGPHVTIMMADDRYTPDIAGNNYMQFAQTAFFSDAQEADVHLISSTPNKKEGHDEYAARLNKELKSCLDKHQNAYVLGLFGIGNDGHTASIFPSDSVIFNQRYGSTEPYIGVFEQGSDYPKRVTVTPDFIKNNINEIVVFAQGKQEILLTGQFLTEKHDFPATLVLRHSNSTLFTNAEIARI